MTMLRGGLKQMQHFLEQEGSRFRSSPILLLVSQPMMVDTDTENNMSGTTTALTQQQQKIHAHAIHQTKFLLQQKMEYQTVLAHCSPHAFPTQKDVDSVMTLSQRVGAYIVAAVGTGNAMDVAKAAYANNDLLDELILIPTTYGASMAASSSHSLLYDSEEQAIVPQPSTEASVLITNRPKTIVALDDMAMFDAVTNKNSTLFGLLAIVLDQIYQSNNCEAIRTNTSSANEYMQTIEQILSCIKGNANDTTSGTGSMEHVPPQDEKIISHLCHTIGASISYGFHHVGDNIVPRSIPLALATSFIPLSNTFSQYSITTVMASFVPAYCDLLLQQRNQQMTPHFVRLIEQIPTSLAPQIITNESYSTLLSHIHSNQVLWNCHDDDLDDEVCRILLHNHLLIP
jgi:hypothetical protein